MAGSSGTGAANDAAIETGAITAEELAKRQADDHQALVDNVENAKAKVAKFEDHLKGAKDSLKTAEAELAAEGN